MASPYPKPPELRQRRNKTSTRATLPTEDEAVRVRIPPMPKRAPNTGKWDERVREWWAMVLRSPMAQEFAAADNARLRAVAELHQSFWEASDKGNVTALINLAREIRLQEALFGLTPMDRRRLQWEIDKGETANERSKRRKQPKADARDDPRRGLKAV